MSKLSLSRTFIYLEKCGWSLFTPYLRTEYDETGIGDTLFNVSHNSDIVISGTDNVIYIGVG